jgi:signal transduction histidine kinase
LLVRPNDLLRRCLEEHPADQPRMLREVKDTLGTVTQRLQQILQTIRRDPGQLERVRFDLNQLAAEMHKTWADLALEKWKLALELDRAAEPLWIMGDVSHLQQALENLLFNSRDATFEMRNHLREEARLPGAGGSLDAEHRQALIDAAAWKGRVVIRTRRAEGRVVLEVQDNGIGMTDEVRRQAGTTHFSTKRDNALFAGISAGMGLGLSFVKVILEHHHAQLEIESEPLRGATFRVIFETLE